MTKTIELVGKNIKTGIVLKNNYISYVQELKKSIINVDNKYIKKTNIEFLKV